MGLMVNLDLADKMPPVHENQHYIVEVGRYPGEELDSYLVRNKQYGVIEYVHSVQHFATEWADAYSRVLNGEKPNPEDINNLPDLG
jgi:hypothetical protein